MEQEIRGIYDLISTSPEKAERFASELLESASDQSARDSISWARAFALVELGHHRAAMQIWQEIFDRTGNHQALHQVGYAQRCSGDVSGALATYIKEQSKISDDDQVAIGANLYEITYCNFLLRDFVKAFDFLRVYEELKFANVDFVERACFFRLKGDLLRSTDIQSAAAAYLISHDYFVQADDHAGAAEINSRISSLL